MTKNVWISFIIYLVYRLFRFLIHSIQTKLLWPCSGISEQLAKINTGTCDVDCQILTILYRRKLVEGVTISINDFMWWHEKFVKAKDVLAPDPCWTLYTLDNEFAYFVKMPKSWPAYHAREAPFVFVRQFQDATKLARMPFKAFCRFATENLPEPKGAVVYCSNAARSGSTLLTRVMQVSEKHIRCFGEPDAFIALNTFQQRGFINEDIAINLVKAIFKFYTKTQAPGQTYFMKIPSSAARIVPLVKKAMPQVKHMFTFRRNTRRVLSSVEKIMRGATAGDVWVTLWKIWPDLTCRIINVAAYEYELFKRFGIRDVLDVAIVMHAGAFYSYYRYRELFDIPIIYYEDLITEKEKTLRQIFEICELPYGELISESLKEFQVDSQGGTAVSQRKMSVVGDTALDQSRIQKLHEICDQLNIPRIDV